MIIYEGTNNLVSGAFIKCFSIYSLKNLISTRTVTIEPYII